MREDRNGPELPKVSRELVEAATCKRVQYLLRVVVPLAYWAAGDWVGSHSVWALDEIEEEGFSSDALAAERGAGYSVECGSSVERYKSEPFSRALGRVLS